MYVPTLTLVQTRGRRGGRAPRGAGDPKELEAAPRQQPRARKFRGKHDRLQAGQGQPQSHMPEPKPLSPSTEPNPAP